MTFMHKAVNDMVSSYISDLVLPTVSSISRYELRNSNNIYYTLKHKKVQVGKDQEKAQSEKDFHSKSPDGKKLN